ncbi:MAG: hypothetical protein MJ086_03395 [Lachnospiraceae bacterium]|nr:hypothetical protein [Lachnospiraceae bacterium]
MKAVDEDCLICDFAQYYHIYDYESLPVRKQAIYAWGLPDDSRIKKAMSGREYALSDLLLMALVDWVGNMNWQYASVNSKHAPQKPQSLMKLLAKSATGEIKGYTDAESFEAERRNILEKINNG